MSLATVLSTVLNSVSSTTSILELGANNITTPILSSFSQKNFKVVTVDFGENNYSPNLANNNHTIIDLNKSDVGMTWEKFVNVFPGKNIGMVLVNQSSWDARVASVMKYKDIIPLVIVPDCDYFANNGLFGKMVSKESFETFTPGIIDFSDTFKSFTVVYPPKPWPMKTGPPVLVGSNVINLNDLQNLITLSTSRSNGESKLVKYSIINNFSQIAELFDIPKDDTIRVATA